MFLGNVVMNGNVWSRHNQNMAKQNFGTIWISLKMCCKNAICSTLFDNCQNKSIGWQKEQ